MIIVVLHGDSHPTELWTRVNHRSVAAIDVPGYMNSTDDPLEIAYMKTQNIDGSWSMPYEDNPQDRSGIVVLSPLEKIDGKEYGHRSTDIGDRMVAFTQSGPKVFEVAPCGFKEIVE